MHAGRDLFRGDYIYYIDMLVYLNGSMTTIEFYVCVFFSLSNSNSALIVTEFYEIKRYKVHTEPVEIEGKISKYQLCVFLVVAESLDTTNEIK